MGDDDRPFHLVEDLDEDHDMVVEHPALRDRPLGLVTVAPAGVYTAVFDHLSGGTTEAPIVGWNNDGEALIQLDDGQLSPAAGEAYRSLTEIRTDAPLAGVLPAGGWMVAFKPYDTLGGGPWSEPVPIVGWVFTIAGEGAAIYATADGSIERVDDVHGHFARLIPPGQDTAGGGGGPT